MIYLYVLYQKKEATKKYLCMDLAISNKLEFEVIT